MGPTAIISLLTYQTVHGMGPEYAILLCFLSGVVELLMGLLGLGKIYFCANKIQNIHTHTIRESMNPLMKTFKS